MVQTNNEEIGNLAKPHRVSLQGIISVVALLVKAISILYEARLGYDTLETYRILPRLFRPSLIIVKRKPDLMNQSMFIAILLLIITFALSYWWLF